MIDLRENRIRELAGLLDLLAQAIVRRLTEEAKRPASSRRKSESEESGGHLDDRIQFWGARMSYEVNTLADLLDERQRLRWIIEGWLEQSTLALLIEAQGSLKSFLPIDWALSVATGRGLAG